MWLSTKLIKIRQFLVSVVNKSQYRDTHSEDTIGNVQDTDYLSFVWSCLELQATHNKYHLYVRTGLLLSHETCFYSTMNDSKEIYAIS